MKKKHIIIGTVSIFLLLFVIWGIRLDSEEVWTEKVLDYLENQYEGQFEVMNIQKDSDGYIYSLRTKDDNYISFDVKCWVGPLLTPWGEMPFTMARHFLDDFPEQITNKFVNSTTTYDMSNRSLEEIVVQLKALSKNVQVYYDLYGLSWQKPEISINIKYNDKIKNFEYVNLDDNMLREKLISVFYQS